LQFLEVDFALFVVQAIQLFDREQAKIFGSVLDSHFRSKWIDITEFGDETFNRIKVIIG
jgi:hypothetical protein